MAKIEGLLLERVTVIVARPTFIGFALLDEKNYLRHHPNKLVKLRK